jgi:hypothetical protein
LSAFSRSPVANANNPSNNNIGAVNRRNFGNNFDDNFQFQLPRNHANNTAAHQIQPSEESITALMVNRLTVQFIFYLNFIKL